MKRWLVWFSLPVVVFAAAFGVAAMGLIDPRAAGRTMAPFFAFWGFVTVFAVPIAVIRWLVVGGRAKQRSAD